MNVFYREHVRGTLCEQLQFCQRITIPPVTNSYTSQAFSFFFLGVTPRKRALMREKMFRVST